MDVDYLYLFLHLDLYPVMVRNTLITILLPRRDRSLRESNKPVNIRPSAYELIPLWIVSDWQFAETRCFDCSDDHIQATKSFVFVEP